MRPTCLLARRQPFELVESEQPSQRFPSCREESLPGLPAQPARPNEMGLETASSQERRQISHHLRIFHVTRSAEQCDLAFAVQCQRGAVCPTGGWLASNSMTGEAPGHQRAEAFCFREASRDIAVDLRHPPTLTGKVEIEAQHTREGRRFGDVTSPQELLPQREWQPELVQQWGSQQQLPLCGIRFGGQGLSRAR